MGSSGAARHWRGRRGSQARARWRRRPLRGGGTGRRSTRSWSTARRTARSTTTTASRPSSGAHGVAGRLHAARRHRAGRSRRSTSTSLVDRRHRPLVVGVHGEWNGGSMDGFFTTDGIDCMGYYTARGPAVLLLPAQALHAVRELLLLGARADLAEPLLPGGRHVGRHHDERRLGLRRARLPVHPRPARRGRASRWKVYNLGGVRRRAGRRQRQRLRVLQALRARPARAGAARTTTSHDATDGTPPERLVHHPELHARASTSTRRPTSRSGCGSRSG